MANGIYVISGVNNFFGRLSDAKYYLEVAFTPEERVKFLPDGCYITHYKSSVAVSFVDVCISTNGDISYSRVYKV